MRDLFLELHPWVAATQNKVMEAGRPLTEQEMKDAAAVGVRYPERIRIQQFSELPYPQSHPVGGFMVDLSSDVFHKETLGLTLGHAICVRKGSENNRSLLIHEFIHVRQQEKMGGVDNFLQVYIQQVAKWGYREAPLEQEAYIEQRNFPLF